MNNEEKDTDRLKTTKEAVCYEKEIVKGRLIAAPFCILLFVFLLVVGILLLFSVDDIKAIVTGIGAIVFGVYGLIIVSGSIKKQVLILKDSDKEIKKKTKRKE